MICYENIRQNRLLVAIHVQAGNKQTSAIVGKVISILAKDDR
jgi:hypothetical protein